MKAFCIALYLLLLQVTASGQHTSLLTLDELNNRVKNGKDTTFIINFWATWCSPCNKELPSFEKLNTEHKNEKLKVLLISVDDIARMNTALIPFVKRKELKSEVFLLNEKDQQQYIDRVDSTWSGSIPATLFIKGKKRKFVEQEFTYPELLNEYQTIKSSL